MAKKTKLTEVILLKEPSCLGEILCTLINGEKQAVEIVETIQLSW